MPRKTRAQKEKAKERFLKNIREHVEQEKPVTTTNQLHHTSAPAFAAQAITPKKNGEEPHLSVFFVRDLTKSLFVSAAVICLIIVLFLINR